MNRIPYTGAVFKDEGLGLGLLEPFARAVPLQLAYKARQVMVAAFFSAWLVSFRQLAVAELLKEVL